MRTRTSPRNQDRLWRALAGPILTPRIVVVRPNRCASCLRVLTGHREQRAGVCSNAANCQTQTAARARVAEALARERQP